jgi:hypothetical protein
MGSSQVKELYKDSKPGQDGLLTFNADALVLGDQYVQSFLKTVQKSISMADADKTCVRNGNCELTFPENNIQKNVEDVDKDFMRSKAMQFLSDNYICGFSNALANI